MNLPNYITLIRILIVPFFFIALTYYAPGEDHFRWIALTLFLVASVTDAVDGFIARRWNIRSELGTFLDPLADKLLLISAFIAAIFSELPLKPPLWVVSIVIFRDIFIIGGLIFIYLTTQKVRVQPNLLGKITTFFQMATIVLILFQSKLALPACYLTAGLTIASGIVYIVREMRRFNELNTLTPKH